MTAVDVEIEGRFEMARGTGGAGGGRIFRMFVFDDEVDEEDVEGYVECIWRRPLFDAIMKLINKSKIYVI